MNEMNSDQIVSLIIGILLLISEALGLVKKGPNGILHLLLKFYSLKDIKDDEDEESSERERNERERSERRVEETLMSDRETIVLGRDAVNGNVGPNVLLIGK